MCVREKGVCANLNPNGGTKVSGEWSHGQMVEQPNKIKIVFCPTKSQKADFLNKHLPGPAFEDNQKLVMGWQLNALSSLFRHLGHRSGTSAERLQAFQQTALSSERECEDKPSHNLSSREWTRSPSPFRLCCSSVLCHLYDASALLCDDSLSLICRDPL